jgi:hypothetical protein
MGITVQLVGQGAQHNQGFISGTPGQGTGGRSYQLVICAADTTRTSTCCPQPLTLYVQPPLSETAERAGAHLLGSLPLDPQFAVMCDDGEIEAYDSEALEPILDQALKRLAASQE